MLNIVVFVSGGGTNLQALIDSQRKEELGEAHITGVISSSPSAYALVRAEKAGIPTDVISPKQYENTEEFAEALSAQVERYRGDLIVLAGYLVVLPPSFVHAYRGRIINIHPSLIPAFCGKGCYGLRVHEAALARGVRLTGATVHIVDEGTDTGPILLQKAVEVYETDTPEVLQKRVMEQAEWKLLPEAVRLFAEGKGYIK